MAAKARSASIILVALLVTASAMRSSASADSPRFIRPEHKFGHTNSPADSLPPASSALQFPGLAGLGVAARIARAGINITLPPVTVAAYINPDHYTERARLHVAPAPVGVAPERPKPDCKYFVNGFYTDAYVMDLYQPDANGSPDSVPMNGKIRSVGKFPDTTVSLLAFGSIPVRAVLHIRQLVDKKKIEPLFINGPIGGRFSYAKGLTIDPSDPSIGSGCDSAWESDKSIPTIATGRVEATISDVRVDGRSVDVGTNCRTSQPLNLHLNGQDPSFGGQFADIQNPDGILYQRAIPGYSSPAHLSQLYPGSSNLEIPPFVGCRAGDGEDVSRLITALTAGSQNTLAVKEGTVAIGTWDPDHPSRCGYATLPENDQSVNGMICAKAPAAPLPPGPGR